MELRVYLVALLISPLMAVPHKKIEDSLASSLAFKGSANVLVSFKEQTSIALASIMNNTYPSRSGRLDTVVSTLQSFAETSQKSAREVLVNLEFSSFEVFWITNQLYLRGADRKVVDAVAAVDNVVEITEEFNLFLDPIVTENKTDGLKATEWGVENIGAPAAWTLQGGNRGERVVVGSIDSGVRASHVDLRDNFVGFKFGWKDFVSESKTPIDELGHGTHSIASAVGRNGIGVAPNAQWMACRVFDKYGGTTDARLINCGQFMTCPFNDDKKVQDCSKAPHVINNSWGGGQNYRFYNDVINAWHAARIIPIFANGNTGPDCRTVVSPADSSAKVISVGSIDKSNSMARTSAKGPSKGNPPLVKPDISAPGVNIRSAWYTADNSYETISGTSMAAPHVAGCVALLLSRKRDLTFDQVRNYLTKTTNREVKQTGLNCGGIPESQYPNNAFGYGIVNARAALAAIIKDYP